MGGHRARRLVARPFRPSVVALLAFTILFPATRGLETPDDDTAGPSTGELAAATPTVEIAAGSGSSWVQTGSASVSTAVVQTKGAMLATSVGYGENGAFRTPQYALRGVYPQAVLRVLPSDGTDAFSPGSRPFQWGASVNLDTMSSGRDADRGDDLVTRGTPSGEASFRAHVDDHRRPGCSVRGADGALTVRSGRAVAAGTWYDVVCSRSAAGLTLRVTQRAGDGSVVDTWARHRAGWTGSVVLPSTVPLAVGGQLSRDGARVLPATDQLNGLLQDPFLQIG